MKLQLTKRGDYAVRAAVALGRHYETGAFRKLRQVSKEMAIPLRYTQEILGLLMRGGLAEAKAGKTGGYRLTVAPAGISLLQLVEAAEGPLASERCTLTGVPCHWQNTICAVHPVWEHATRSLRNVLQAHTLAGVIETDSHLAQNLVPRSESAPE